MSIAKIVGAASNSCWSQVLVLPAVGSGQWVNESDFPRGLILVAVSVKGKGKTDGENDVGMVGREVLQRIEEEMGGEVEANVNLIKEMVERVVGDYKEAEVELVIGKLKKGELDLVGGKGKVLMLRDGEVGVVYGGGKAEITRTSGKIKERDVVVVGTRDIFKLVSVREWQKILMSNGETSEGVAEWLTSMVHGRSGNEGVAAVVVKVGSEKVNESQEDVVELGEVGLVDEIKRKIEAVVGQIRGQKWMGRGKMKKMLRRKPEVFLRKSKSKRLTMSVGIVFLGLLLVSLVLGWRKRMVEKDKQAFEVVYKPAKERYEQAFEFEEINPLRSRSLLVEAKQLVDDGLVGLDERNRYYDELEEFGEQIDEVYKEVSGEKKIEKAELFLDLSLVREGTFGSMMALVDDQLVVLDREDGVVIGVVVSSKRAEVVGGGDLFAGAKLVGLAGRRGIAVADKGIVDFSLSEKTSAVLVERDDVWNEPRALATFGANIYLLDGQSGDIWRYPGITGGVGARQRWLAPGIVPDFSKVSDMEIDGYVWVLTRSGRLEKYAQGAPVTFNVVGLSEELKEPVAVYTNDDIEEVYVLDRGNERVVVFNKEGEYQEQYLWEGISGVNDMVVSEENRKILLLSGSTIYEIPLGN